MKQSQFNILVYPPECPEQVILYNTFHDHRIILENTNNNVSDFFSKIDQRQPLNDEESSLAHQFYEMGILLDDSADERQIFDDWYSKKIQQPKGLLNLVLVVTMACNLRCPYCYELDQLDNKRSMTMEMAENFVNWVKSEVRNNPIEDLEIVYFGGEPLMNKKVVFFISEQLQDFCKSYGIRYHGKMVSNGVLMTPKVSKKLREVGVNKIKVTLDGDKEFHDTTRITASGKGSFDQVWYNMEHANDDPQPFEDPIQFVIGGNFLDETYSGFFPLLDKLAESSFKPYISEINLKPVQDVGLDTQTELSSNPCDVNCFNETNTQRMIKLREELVARDLPPTDGLNLGPCDFYRGDSYTIGLDGYVFSCIAFVDIHNMAVGHLENDKVIQAHHDKQNEWEETKPWTEECYECSFLPVCAGGCRATAYSNGYGWSSEVCEKDYFERMSKALAKEMLNADIAAEIIEPELEVNLSTLALDEPLKGATEFIRNDALDFVKEV